MFNSILYPIGKTMDCVLSPLLSFPPFVTVALLSFISTLLVIGLTRMFTDKEELESMKKRSKELKEKMIKVQKSGKENEIQQVLNEVIEINKKMMKNSFKILAFSLLVAILILPWLSIHYSKEAMFILPISVPFIGSKISWVIWYVIVGFIFSYILNKLIGVSV